MALLRVRRASKTLIAFIVAIPLTTMLSSCASDPNQCQAGGESSEHAVEIFLQAAVTGDLETACRVTPEASDDVLTQNLSVAAKFIQAAGGIEAVTTRELVEEQLGRGHFVEVSAATATSVVKFMVIDNDGKFLIGLSTPQSTPAPAETPASAPH